MGTGERKERMTLETRMRLTSWSGQGTGDGPSSAVECTAISADHLVSIERITKLNTYLCVGRREKTHGPCTYTTGMSASTRRLPSKQLGPGDLACGRLPMWVWRLMAAPHMQKLALVSVLAVTAGHVVAAHISLRPAVHGSTVGPRGP